MSLLGSNEPTCVLSLRSVPKKRSRDRVRMKGTVYMDAYSCASLSLWVRDDRVMASSWKNESEVLLELAGDFPALWP